MPRIREYQNINPSSQTISGRRADATDFGGGKGLQQVGNAIMGVGGDLAQIAYTQQQAKAQREVTDVFLSFAKKESDWTQRLQDEHTKADPADLHFAEKFNDALAKDIDTLEPKYETLQGREEFARHRARLGSQFVEKAGRVQSAMTGQYAKESYLQFLDQKRNAVLHDPSSFDRAKDESLKFIQAEGGFTQYLSPEVRAQLEHMTVNDLALSAVQGRIKTAPAMAEAELTSGAWDQYLDADKKHALLSEAAVAIHGLDAEAERVRKVQERQLKAERQATQDGFIAKVTGGELTVPDVLNSNLEPTGEGGKEHYIYLIKQREKELAEKPIKTKPSVMIDLFDRIHAPEGDPRKITTETAIDQAYLNEDLSFADLQHLRKEVAELRTESGANFSQQKKGLFDAIKPSIDKSNPLMGKMDPSGAQWFYKYTSYVEKQVSAYRQAGKDPWELLDPTSSAYLGRPEIIQQFQPTMQDSMKALSENLQRGSKPVPAPAKPRLPGETIQQWFNRKGQVEAAPTTPTIEPSKPETSALDPAPVEGIRREDVAFTKGVVEKMKGSDRIQIATWAKLFREGRMKDEDLRRQLGRVFEGYLKGRPKDLNRAVATEVFAIKQLRPID